MSIVKMSRIRLIGLAAEKTPMLSLLMRRGFVQIDDSGYLTQEEDFADGESLLRDGNDTAVATVEEKILRIEQAIALLKKLPLDKSEKKALKGALDAGGMLSPKAGYQALTDLEKEALLAETDQVLALQSKRQGQKAEENRMLAVQNALRPWSKLDLPLDQTETKCTKLLMGTFGLAADIPAIRQKLSQECPEAFLGEIDRDKRAIYTYLVAHKAVLDDAAEIAKGFGFTPVTFDEHGTVLACIQGYDEKIAQLRQEQANVETNLKTYLPKLPAYRNLCDNLMVQRDSCDVLSNLVKTKETFYLEGWLPQSKAVGLEKELRETYTCYIETRDAQKDEDFPILLENKKVPTPFESVTNMYSCPNPKDVDPTSIMTFFYILFFGIMMGDAGYGLIITIACLIVCKRAQFAKKEGSLIKMMVYCGISTTIWGFIFGSFFGVAIPGLLNPLDDVMTLMGLSLVLGIIHIFTGLFIKGYMYLRDGDPWSFVCDILFWVAVVLGVCLLVVPIVAGPIGIGSVIGKYLAIIGAVGIILTGGRQNKNIFARLGSGLYSLYGISSYVGDILSYTRLLALCLSSGVIAQVVDLLGMMTGPVGLVFISLIGHGINLFIGVLGAYVHTSRLQYVEFFGKFYIGGGTPFHPFCYKPKYTKIKE